MLLRNGRQPEPVDVRLLADRVVECGPRLEPHEGERVLDLGGRTLRRGLRDAHVHFAEWARSRVELDLSGAASVDEAARRVAGAAADLPAGAPVRGSGFRDVLWSEAPTRQVLDRAAGGRAVVLHSLDRHTVWLSSRALEAAGRADHPTGLLREHEAWQAIARLPPPSEAEDDVAAEAAVTAAHARGVTAVRDFDFADAGATWRRRQAAGRMRLRVTAVVMRDRLAAYVEAGRRTGSGEGLLRVGPVKLFVDGSLGSRTARCLHPYAGTTDRGRLLLDAEGLRQALHEARSAGFGVAVHAIGDEANAVALTAIGQVPVRASVEHAQLLRRDDLPRFAAAGVVASVQPAHLLDDAALVDHHWQGTPSLPYAVRSLVDAGARVVLGSDAPVSPLDPWRSIAAAVHRSDGVLPPWHVEEAVDLETALAASGARRVRAGDDADLVVLDVGSLDDRRAADLLTTPVHATCVAGQWVHGPWRDA